MLCIGFRNILREFETEIAENLRTPSLNLNPGYYKKSTGFFYKHKVHKHTQPQIGRILSTLLSTAPASDLVVDIKINQNLQFFL